MTWQHLLSLPSLWGRVTTLVLLPLGTDGWGLAHTQGGANGRRNHYYGHLVSDIIATPLESQGPHARHRELELSGARGGRRGRHSGTHASRTVYEASPPRAKASRRRLRPLVELTARVAPPSPPDLHSDQISYLESETFESPEPSISASCAAVTRRMAFFEGSCSSPAIRKRRGEA